MIQPFDDTTRTRRGGDAGRIRRSLLTAAVLIGYALLVAGAGLLLDSDLLTGRLARWHVAAVPAIAAVAVFVVFLRYLRRMDELERRVQLEALALAGGVGWLLIPCYWVFEELGLPAADAGNLVLALSVTYTIGLVIGWRRYR